MRIISHRGNLSGRNPDCENNPTYIQQAIDVGFDVEIDVWYVDGRFFLGHDAPTYLVDPCWFSRKPLWCHAKNQEALEQMLTMKDVICFWHQNDKMTLTNTGVLWLYPGNYSRCGVTVVLDDNEPIPTDTFGICTDYPNRWRKL